MTTDQRKAFEAWWERKEQAEPMPPEYSIPPSPREFAAMGWQAATAVEREACAEVVDSFACDFGECSSGKIAAAIRKRGEE